ncbi:MAG: aspartyl protease family protein [Candidatus Poribacteria bacterium]|nr:aspartyl protease family protein [Candidatus Poribacteria bacterium]
MRHTTEIKLANLSDLFLMQADIMKPEDVRRLTVDDALVDTGATRLCLPTSLIEQLGLTPVGKRIARTATGIVERTLYSEVEYTLLERSGTIRVTTLPEGSPTLIGHMVLEDLDLCVDMRRGLIYNPAHGDDWIEEQL